MRSQSLQIEELRSEPHLVKNDKMLLERQVTSLENDNKELLAAADLLSEAQEKCQLLDAENAQLNATITQLVEQLASEKSGGSDDAGDVDDLKNQLINEKAQNKMLVS